MKSRIEPYQNKSADKNIVIRQWILVYMTYNIMSDIICKGQMRQTSTAHFSQC